MPFVSQLYYRDVGAGIPVVHLHGGWGYEVYSAQRQIDGMPDVRFLIPDRTGYGRSARIVELPIRFHEAAAAETEQLLDALAIPRCVLWGHSDGAVIAAILGLRTPERYAGIVLEALHRERLKPRSREFFLQMANAPESFGERVTTILRADHGEHWADVLRMGGRAWVDIAARAGDPAYDLFGNRLSELATRTLVLHGAGDPRTEPGELDLVRSELPKARFEILAEGGHCPHAERRTADACTAILRDFVCDVA